MTLVVLHTVGQLVFEQLALVHSPSFVHRVVVELVVEQVVQEQDELYWEDVEQELVEKVQELSVPSSVLEELVDEPVVEEQQLVWVLELMVEQRIEVPEVPLLLQILLVELVFVLQDGDEEQVLDHLQVLKMPYPFLRWRRNVATMLHSQRCLDSRNLGFPG